MASRAPLRSSSAIDMTYAKSEVVEYMGKTCELGLYVAVVFFQET